MQKVRLADIAQKLGVSTVTVHNALCGRKGVSDEMRARILKTAKEMGYEAGNASKKKKEAEKIWNIGVIIAENYLAQHATYYWKMYQEFALAAVEKHCYTIVDVLKKDAEVHTLEIPEALLEKSVDALAVIGEIDAGYIQRLREEMHMPIVFLDFYNKDIAKDAVVANNFYGMYQMTELLFDQGLEELAFIGSTDATSSIMDRYCGFMKSMLSHHKTVPEEWVIRDRDEMGRLGFELPRYMPQAFVCNCDLVAGMLIAKLEAAGYWVPEDISVVGFANFEYPGYTETKITTFEVDMKAMTKTALDKILKQLRMPGRNRSLDMISGHVRCKNSVKMK